MPIGPLSHIMYLRRNVLAKKKTAPGILSLLSTENSTVVEDKDFPETEKSCSEISKDFPETEKNCNEISKDFPETGKSCSNVAVTKRDESCISEQNLIENLKCIEPPLCFSCDKVEDENQTDEKADKISNNWTRDGKDEPETEIISSPQVDNNQQEQLLSDVKIDPESVTENMKSLYIQEEDPESNNKDDVDDWEEMFDENGDLQSKYIKEIAKRISCDVKVVKASNDYSAYQNNNNKYEDLEHVIELYDFPATLRTQDLIQMYSTIYSNHPVYIRWCDDTHALLVLSTPSQAQRALQLQHQMIKSRPLSEGSYIARSIACGLDLKPAMKRPPTNMQTARRLINIHLGTKSALTTKTAVQERKALLEAKEQKRQEKQNERDAWDGYLKSAK